MTQIKQISKIDPGELLLETAKNAEHITPEMQRAIARFMELWSTPIMQIKRVKVDL